MPVALNTDKKDTPPMQSDITLTTPEGAQADLCLSGGQVIGWKTPDKHERLFLSPHQLDDAALRGGIPIIFPQFSGFGPLNKHGFARNMPWQAVEVSATTAHLRLHESPHTLAMWPHAFTLDLTVHLTAQALAVRLTVHNTGPQAFPFTAALHTYFRVDDLAAVRIGGLGGLAYQEFGEAGHQTERELAITQPTDRIYWDVPKQITLSDGDHHLSLTHEGFPDVVVWNPGEHAANIPDLVGGLEREFVCIEAALIGNPVTLQAGESWQGAQMIEAFNR